MNKAYTVTQVSPNSFNIIDISNGSVSGRIITQGSVVSGPIVVGDRCTFVVETGPNRRMGMIYSLPGGSIINRYLA